MQRIIGRIKKEKIFFLASLAYAILAAIIFPYVSFYVDNPDTISYITIAQKYVRADFSNAINGYWSPLLTWILALSLKLGGNEIITFKILQLLAGWFTLFTFVKLADATIQTLSLRVALSFSVIPFILSYALLNLTADLLFLTVLLFYLTVVSERDFFNLRQFGLIAGVLGVLMYFSKSFGFCFFLAHFTVLFLKNYFQTNEYAFKRHLRKNYLQAIICFLCISSIWIYLVSYKYGHFTISENISFNLSKEVAAAPEKENKLPVLSGGLYRPVTASAVNAWEDPGLAVAFTPLRPFSFPDDRDRYIDVLKRNLLTIYYFDFRRQAGMLFAVLLAAFLIFGKRKRFFTDHYFFPLFTTLILVYGGYSLILVHTRYVWVCTLLMLLLSCWLLEELLSKNKIQQGIAKVLFIFLVLILAVKRPVKEILFSTDNDMAAPALINSLLHPRAVMDSTYKIDKGLAEARNEMKKLFAPHSGLASVQSPGVIRDSYTQASLFALSSNAIYLGQISPERLNEIQLGPNRVDYLLTFENDLSTAVLQEWEVVYSKPDLPLKIYRNIN
jgi:hypothetical protein